MADKVTPLTDRPLSNESALARIQQLADRGGKITWATGIEERAMALGLTTNDILVVIRDGTVVGNRKVGPTWRYMVEGWCAEGFIGIEVEIVGLLMIVRLIVDPGGTITTE